MDPFALAFFILGIASSLCLGLVPLGPFMHIRAAQSVMGYSPDLYQALSITFAMWFFYGIVNPSEVSKVAVGINGLGCLIMLAFLAFFVKHSVGAQRMFVLLLLMIKFAFMTMIAITVFMMDLPNKRVVVGWMAAGLAIILYSVPVSAMKKVIITKNLQSMPFLPCLFAFARALFLSLYSAVVYDPFLLVPHVIGVLVFLGQLLVYKHYYKVQS